MSHRGELDQVRSELSEHLRTWEKLAWALDTADADTSAVVAMVEQAKEALGLARRATAMLNRLEIVAQVAKARATIAKNERYLASVDAQLGEL